MKLSKRDEQLRGESPAYQPGAGWEELEPQGMNVVLSVRFDAPTAHTIHELARQTGRSPSRLIRDWTLERLESMANAGTEVRAGVRETPASYARKEDAYEAARERYRPEPIDILLVGESRPAGGTLFYLANSNLYYATHEAFQLAFGQMPAGSEFLETLQERGVWLYDLADAPVDRLRGRPRRAAVQARVSDLVALLRESQPRLVVAIKRDLEATVRQALQDAALDTKRLRVLPFPLYQWRNRYVHGLAQLVGGKLGTQTGPSRKRRPAEKQDIVVESAGLPSAHVLVQNLVGKELRTLTGAPNRILRVAEDKIFVATSRSPNGKPIPLHEVQAALDKLARSGDLLIDVRNVGHRSAFIGAVLSTLPGVEVSVNPRRIRLTNGPSR